MRRSPFPPSPGMGGGGGGEAMVISAVGRLVARGRSTKPISSNGSRGATSSPSSGRSAVVSPRRERVRIPSPPPSSATSALASATTCLVPLVPFNVMDDWLEVGSEGELEEMESDMMEREDEEVVVVEMESDMKVDERLVFAPPTREEIHEAISGIQKVTEAMEDKSPPYLDQKTLERETISVPLSRVSSAEISIGSSDSDWVEPTMQLSRHPNFQSAECQNVLDSFYLLRTNPSIQKMVVSLTSDKAVWEAVMKNQVVQDYRRSLGEDSDDRGSQTKESDDPPNPGAVLKWILGSTKAKIMEFVNIVAKLMHELFHPEIKDEKTDLIGDFVRTSFMLSVVVFIVVAVTRVKAA